MERIVIVLVLLELAVLAAFFSAMLGADTATALGATAAQSAEMLTAGVLAPYFWGMVVVCGLALPLIMAVIGLASKKKDVRAATAIGAIGALVGGCELRFLILAAGLHANLAAAALMAVAG